MKDDEFSKSQKIVRGAAGALLAFVVLCVVAAFCAGLGGCATTTIGQSYDVVNANSRVIGKLETSIENFDRGIGEAVERSRGIESELERVDYLFGQYERLVGGLRDEVNSLRAEIERLEKVCDDSGDAGPSVSGH